LSLESGILGRHLPFQRSIHNPFDRLRFVENVIILVLDHDLVQCASLHRARHRLALLELIDIGDELAFLAFIFLVPLVQHIALLLLVDLALFRNVVFGKHIAVRSFVNLLPFLHDSQELLLAFVLGYFLFGEPLPTEEDGFILNLELEQLDPLELSFGEILLS
jgi:hypothetical protein